MRNVVEIGLGREARRMYGLGEVDLVPSRRTRSSKEVSTSWQIDAYQMDIPVMTHPTDAVVSPSSAVEFSGLGGLAVLNGEGLWARHADPEAVIDELRELALEDVTGHRALARLQELHRAPVDRELLAAAVSRIRDGGATVAVRVSPQHARDLTPGLVAAGIDLLVVQGTIISAEHVSGEDAPLNLKEFIGGLDVPVIAGGVVDYKTALHLMRTGAAGVIVGYGGADGVTTTGPVLGMEVHMATAIADAAAARRDYLDETGGRYVHVLADGDIYTSGDIARAIACGADAVVLGPLLAGALQSPGRGVYWNSVAAHPNVPRGLVTEIEDETALAPLVELLEGPTSIPDGTRNLMGGLRRAMAKCGYSDVKSFQKVDLSVRP
ncbi:GuaB3 family IMP dehydrogenase-related protein [Dietzia sp. ANT_WB102]|uniref:GuaB3 family IMP dehydrogenase-related protein n=1 Tax=Dietzia sp. ANT_WB102 TaxID=2597345 RepID=UPI0011ED191C|nr:GuaB3 family IMP dehydrogenase-related protein [Dietzia sp. ANT_WB102]KAA0916953.1 GuaB3 family IMP dehydrogenase-related protein [Dietzia sp. ANT_WB102]